MARIPPREHKPTKWDKEFQRRLLVALNDPVFEKKVIDPAPLRWPEQYKQALVTLLTSDPERIVRAGTLLDQARTDMYQAIIDAAPGRTVVRASPLPSGGTGYRVEILGSGPFNYSAYVLWMEEMGLLGDLDEFFVPPTGGV